MKRFFAFVFCAAVLFTACQKEPSLTLSGPTSLEMSADGSSGTVSFTVNRDWTASASESWVTVSPSSGSASDGPVSITIKASPNTTYEDRNATVTIKAEGLTQTVSVRQPANLGVVVPTKSYEVTSDARTIEVEVQSNVDYKVTVSDSWIKQTGTGTKGLKKETLTFSVEANSSYDARSATITVKPQSGSGSEEIINVRQAQKDALLVGTVTYSMPYGGGEVEVKVEANVAFEVNSGVDWIEYVDTKALSTSTVRLKVVENTSAKAREGKVEIKQKGGSLTKTVTIKQSGNEVTKIKNALMKIYDAMNGPKWKMTKKWDMSKPLNEWEGVWRNEETGEFHLFLGENLGLKGELPDCFADLTSLTQFVVQHEPGVTGTLPSSIGKLKNLEYFSVCFTSMTSLPDIFKNVPLKNVLISCNEKMTGPLPESLGSSSKLDELSIAENAFTGTVPDSWARLGTGLEIKEAYLDDRVPESFVQSEYADYLVNMYLVPAYLRTTPLVVGNYDIKAYWPKRDIKDIVTGKAIPYKKIVSNNKATVLLNWATWCPFSKELMPSLKKMYEKYHKDGLEIIASFNADPDGTDEGRPLKDVILEKGYDKWYNFDIWAFQVKEWEVWASATPSAIVVDNKGRILRSSLENVSDPARNRFGYVASARLIPVLEEMFGPLEEKDDYSSKDYSQDGKVLTLQKASKGNGINLVFMGDAYTDKDMKSGLYETLMRDSMEEFFAIEPYKTFRDRFNVYAVKVVSKNGKTGDGYSTALGCVTTFGSISSGNLDKCYEYALKVPGIKNDKNLMIGVLVNSLVSRGITVMSESKQSAVAFYGSNDNEADAFGSTLRHEAGGHGFAFLDDEYVTNQGAATKDHINHRNTMYKKYGWFANVDFTNDPEKVKWSAFLSDKRYKDEVGIYEGGSLYAKGAYRPSGSSLMRDYGDFNAPSRWAIYQRIMKLSGETCTFENFLKYDAVNRGKSQSAVRPPLKVESLEPGAPPIIVP